MASGHEKPDTAEQVLSTWEVQEHLQRFIANFNHERYPESLDNLTPADVFYGRGEKILDWRETIKLNTLAM